MDEHVLAGLNLLGLVRAETAVIGVAVSFGKDSLATLDLCCRIFRRVEAYYLYRVAGLEIVDSWREEVRERTGVDVRMYPHFDLARCYRHSILQPAYVEPDCLFAAHPYRPPRIDMAAVESAFRQDADVEWIAYGWRRTDSLSRALIMKQCGGYDTNAHRVFPLRVWRRQQIYDYLDERKIPRPPTLGRKEQGGLDFHAEALRALSPSDRERWLTDFPYSGIQLIDPQSALDRERNDGTNVG